MSNYRVCDRCDGEGKHTNPSIDGNGLTYSDIQELGGDDFMEEYMSGMYDITCSKCHGKRVITDEDDEDYDRRNEDARTRQMESGIYPGHRDWRGYL